MKDLATNIIHQGDVLEVLQSLPSDSVDAAFADPPFNLKKKYNSYRDNMALEDYVAWCNAWLTEMVRVVKPTGSIFVHNIPRWLTYYAAHLNTIADFRHWISWDAMGSPLGSGLLPNHYGILFYAKDVKQNKFYDLRYPHHRCRKCHSLRKDYGGKKHLLHPFGPLVSDVWTDIHRIRHPKRRNKHPCQLPIPLLERVILMSTDENDIVLDPFAGTGTSLVAAHRLGRRYIGIELDEKYVDIARENIVVYYDDESNVDGSWVSWYLGQVVTIRDADWDRLKRHFVVPSPVKAIDTTPIRFEWNGGLSADDEDASPPPPPHLKKAAKPIQLPLLNGKDKDKHTLP